MARKVWRHILVALIVVATASTLTAFAKEPMTVVWRGSQQSLEALEAIVTKWGAERGIEIEVIPGTGDWPDYYDSFAIRAAGGVPFDLVMIDMQAIPFGHSGVFIDLTSYIERDGVASIVPPITLQAYTVHGKIYGFPHSVFPQVGFYNEDLFAAAGLATPTTDWRSDEWTLDDFITAARRLTQDTNSDGVIDQWGVIWPPDIVPTMGAQWLGPDGGFAATDPTLINALLKGVEINVEMHISPRPGDADPGGGWNPFPHGKIGMAHTGVWLSDYLRDTEFSWNIGATPKGVRRASPITIDAFGIGVTSTYKDEAWELIKYLTLDPEGSYAFSRTATYGVAVGPNGQLGYRDGQLDLYPHFNAQVAIDALDYAVLHPFRQTIEFRQLEALKGRTVDAALSGEIPVQAALEELKRLGDPLLQAGK